MRVRPAGDADDERDDQNRGRRTSQLQAEWVNLEGVRHRERLDIRLDNEVSYPLSSRMSKPLSTHRNHLMLARFPIADDVSLGSRLPAQAQPVGYRPRLALIHRR